MRYLGIGDCIAILLASIGATEERAERLFKRFGFRGCYCGTLRRWINRRRRLHQLANCLGFQVQYDNGTVW